MPRGIVVIESLTPRVSHSPSPTVSKYECPVPVPDSSTCGRRDVGGNNDGCCRRCRLPPTDNAADNDIDGRFSRSSGYWVEKIMKRDAEGLEKGGVILEKS